MCGAVDVVGRAVSAAGCLLAEVNIGCEAINLLDHLDDNEEGQTAVAESK